MFFIDQQTIDYLKLTGREDEQVKLVETYASEAGLWSDTGEGRVRARAALRPVHRGAQHGRPSNPHKRLPVSELAATASPARSRTNRARCPMARSSSPPSPAAPTPATRAT
jgi:aconitate hydratase